MVKIITLFFALYVCACANAQENTLNCEESFAYYDSLLEKNLIVLWETPPSIKKCSLKDISLLEDLVKKKSNYEYVLVDIIIDSEGNSNCYRFKQEITSEIKKIIIDKLKLLGFNPALQKGKGVESIYTLKL